MRYEGAEVSGNGAFALANADTRWSAIGYDPTAEDRPLTIEDGVRRKRLPDKTLAPIGACSGNLAGSPMDRHVPAFTREQGLSDVFGHAVRSIEMRLKQIGV